MPTITKDVFIYGGTMFGIIAARRLALAGYAVQIAEWTPFTGGLSCGGLGLVDHVNDTYWGLMLDWFADVKAYADAHGGDSAVYGIHPSGCMRRFLPSWARSGRDTFLDHANISVVKDIELLSVAKDPISKRITSVVLDDGNTYVATNFGDASYEGDLLRMAGIPMEYGRNSARNRKEFYNGGFAPQFQVESSGGTDRQVRSDNGNLWNEFSWPVYDLVQGQADYKTQPYDFRMTLSTDTDRLAFPTPPNFNAKDFEDFVDQTVLRNYSTIETISSYQDITDKLHGCNGADWTTGHAWQYPRLRTKAERLRFIDQMYYRHAGLYVTARDDVRCPSALRTSMAAHGLPATENQDEYIGAAGWSSAIYPRVVNRMIGQYVGSWADMTGASPIDDPIYLGGYNADRHSLNQYPTSTGGHIAEGLVDDTGRTLYPVSWRQIIPHPGACTNIVSMCAVSCTDIQMSSHRVEPTWMLCGDAGGLALTLAMDMARPVGLVPYSALLERLVDAGAVLS